MPNGLIYRERVKELVRELRPGKRVSKAYLDALSGRLRDLVKDHVKVSGSQKTLTADVLLGVPAGKGRVG